MMIGANIVLELSDIITAGNLIRLHVCHTSSG